MACATLLPQLILPSSHVQPEVVVAAPVALFEEVPDPVHPEQAAVRVEDAESLVPAAGENEGGVLSPGVSELARVRDLSVVDLCGWRIQSVADVPGLCDPELAVACVGCRLL